MAQQTDKDKGTEQEVFLGVKGNAQASADHPRALSALFGCACCNLLQATA